jgi:hypothetical protein
MVGRGYACGGGTEVAGSEGLRGKGVTGNAYWFESCVGLEDALKLGAGEELWEYGAVGNGHTCRPPPLKWRASWRGVDGKAGLVENNGAI